MKYSFFHSFHAYGMPKDVRAELSLLLGAVLMTVAVTMAIYGYAALLR